MKPELSPGVPSTYYWARKAPGQARFFEFRCPGGAGAVVADLTNRRICLLARLLQSIRLVSRCNADPRFPRKVSCHPPAKPAKFFFFSNSMQQNRPPSHSLSEEPSWKLRISPRAVSMRVDDAECVRACLGGKPDMFRHLVMRFEAPVIKSLVGQLGDENEALEAAQETMVRAYFDLAKLKNAESFFPWLLAIADRVAQEMRRARRRHPVSLDFEVSSAFTEGDLTAEERHSEPELSRALAELPEPYRQVILMRFYGGQSCSEISRNLRVSLGTVTSRLSRAYTLLREVLRTDEQEPEKR
jgi:RNA polymerase sigma-70 factor (ECF subfamily)